MYCTNSAIAFINYKEKCNTTKVLKVDRLDNDAIEEKLNLLRDFYRDELLNYYAIHRLQNL
jgi:hypothetical protein